MIPFRRGKSILLNLSASLENLCSSYWILASWEKYKAGREKSVFFKGDNPLLPWFTLQNKSQKRSETTGILDGSRTSMRFHFVNMERFPSFEVLYIYQLFPSKKKQKVVATTIAFTLNLGVLQMEESIVHLEIQTRKMLQFQLVRMCTGVNLIVVFVIYNIDLTYFHRVKAVTICYTSRYITMNNVLTILRPGGINSRHVGQIKRNSEGAEGGLSTC